MSSIPNDDKPGFVAEKPEHCVACYRLIRPGQTYHLTMGQAILSKGCLQVADVIRVTDDLAVAVEDGRPVVRRGKTTVDVFPSEVRHLVEAAMRIADGQAREEEGICQRSRQAAVGVGCAESWSKFR